MSQDAVKARLLEANGRLKANNYGVTIEKHGSRLYLRTTLPPHPTSTKTQNYQQRIPIAAANGEGVRLAEAEAKKLRLRLDSKIFTWDDYKPQPEDTSKPQTVQQWIAAFEQDYFERKERNHKTSTTWEKDYLLVFKKLDPEVKLTPELLKATIIQTQPDTRTRKRFCIILGALAKFAEIDFNPKPLAGKYSSKRVAPRHLPEDELIVEWFFNISDPAWRWVYAAIATYGLRNHEAFFLDIESLAAGNSVATVMQGKTGYRKVWPCHPEWYEQLELQKIRVPPIKLDRSNSKIGNTTSQYFHRTAKLPFKIFDLRHCWAIRTLEYGLEVSLAAQQMGHSASVHTELYHHWISEKHHQKAFETLMLRPDRPRPPKLPI